MPELNLQLMDADSGDVIPQPELPDEKALVVLEQAEITAAELVPWGSNHTFAVALEMEDGPGHLGIYKPKRGERPLWDFRQGSLYVRERASYLLSRALGWGIVPPTVIRDGPYGVGSLQIYVPSDPAVFEDAGFWGTHTIGNERIVLFDHLVNNADRKITHCLLSVSGRIVGIDHGLTFHEEPKLRTVMWQFANGPIRPELREDLGSLLARRDEVDAWLSSLLTAGEVAALWRRATVLHERGTYPELDPRRNIPYGWW